MANHDKELLKFAVNELSSIPGMTIFGPLAPKLQSGIVLFEIKGIDSGDLAVALSEYKDIAVRSGFMCAEPIVRSINEKGLCRASFYIYNTKDDIITLSESLSELAKTMR